MLFFYSLDSGGTYYREIVYPGDKGYQCVDLSVPQPFFVRDSFCVIRTFPGGKKGVDKPAYVRLQVRAAFDWRGICDGGGVYGMEVFYGYMAQHGFNHIVDVYICHAASRYGDFSRDCPGGEKIFHDYLCEPYSLFQDYGEMGKALCGGGGVWVDWAFFDYGGGAACGEGGGLLQTIIKKPEKQLTLSDIWRYD